MNAARGPEPAADYKDTLAWLFGTQLFGIKLGLGNIERLLRELDCPTPGQRIIHVAGTNGKGSVCAMVDSVSRAAGYRTGLFTSPHLVTFRERIRVDGAMIQQAQVAAGLTTIREMMRDWDPHPTFFEIATALAFHHFKEEECEIIVLETGMGGRLDATNAITPAVSVITPIDYDHQKWLGQTLAEIAAEKAGIIKPGVPVISAPQQIEAETVIREKANACSAPLRVVSSTIASVPIGLAGVHQKENAALAIAALEAGGIEVDEKSVTTGLAMVQWPARFQRWSEQIVIDGAHNPAGARVLAQTWREAFGDERPAIVLAVLADKDVKGIVEALAPLAQRFILPRARAVRAVGPEHVRDVITTVAPDLPITVADAFDVAFAAATSTPARVLITGSLHFAGEALAALAGDPDELEDCAQ